MGQVPSDARVAANEAFSSILSASDKGVKVFFIDLLLPSYDVTQGSTLYDEVLAVEYCIALADCLKEKSLILVRDDKTVQTVNRILNLRQRNMPPPETDPLILVDNELTNDDDEENEEQNVVPATDDTILENMENESTRSSEVDLFRQQLMTSWTVDDNGPKLENEQNKVLPAGQNISRTSRGKLPPMNLTPQKRYRLGSLFGDARISDGPDMMEKVVEALRANALPNDNEQTLVILSAVTREEMVAVRSLVTKYGAHKKIILVNCKLNPIPKELYGAETVYSILPLIAKGTNANSQASPADGKILPKVVVLRRYPGDWQVFVDAGKGFKLAKTAPNDLSNKRGPPIKWVQQSVQEFMKRII